MLYLSDAPLSLHSIRYRQLQYTKLLDCIKWNYIFGVTILQMEQKTKFWKIWPCTSNFTYAQVYSITTRGLGQDSSCCFVFTEECDQNTTGAFNMLWKWDISIIIIWLWSRRLQMFSKNSGLKVAQINCIRMEIVFGVPQQVLLEETNFHLGPNSFLLWENVILCSLQYILTNPTFLMKFVVQYICLR